MDVTSLCQAASKTGFARAASAQSEPHPTDVSATAAATRSIFRMTVEEGRLVERRLAERAVLPVDAGAVRVQPRVEPVAIDPVACSRSVEGSVRPRLDRIGRGTAQTISGGRIVPIEAPPPVAQKDETEQQPETGRS